MKLETLAEELLETARRRGATDADTLVTETTSFSVVVRLGEIETLTNAQTRHLQLRLFLGERSALTSTADLTREGLERLVEENLALARAIAADPFSGLPDAAELAREVPDLDLYDDRALALPVEEKIALAREAEAAARGFDPRIVNSEGAQFSTAAGRVVYASTRGFLGHYRSSTFSLHVVPVAGQDGSMQRDYWYSAGRKLDLLDPAEAVGKKAAERALRRLGARRVKTQRAPVVFDPESAATLLGHLAGAVSGPSLYRNTSFLLGRLGERIAPQFLSVEDNGLIPAAPGSRPFDGEGLPTRPTAVVRDGVLASYLLDTYSARKLGLKATAHATRSLADSPGAGPTNLYVGKGAVSPDEIIRSVRSGLYVTELAGFGVNQTTGDYSRGAVGLWIEDGELAFPVEEITIAGNLVAMLQSIEMVGSDLELRSSISAPTLKIAEMTIGGE